MKQFEQTINPENSPEYSPEMIEFLQYMKKKFNHYLTDFESEIPKEIISGKMEYKCQKNWFIDLVGVEVIDERLKKNGKQDDRISELAEEAERLRLEVNKSEKTTEEQIKEASGILKATNSLIDDIIGE
jgi:hypothetical protein